MNIFTLELVKEEETWSKINSSTYILRSILRSSKDTFPKSPVSLLAMQQNIIAELKNVGQDKKEFMKVISEMYDWEFVKAPEDH